MTTLPSTIINTITQDVPTPIKRSINKEFLLTYSHDYCTLAAHIYHDDMIYAMNHFNHYAIYYHHQAYVKINKTILKYKIKQVDDNYIVTLKNKNTIEDINNNIIDIDLLSQYQILKNRGCEDLIQNYSQKNILKILSTQFHNYFNPDQIQDLLYLYVYLHSNYLLIHNKNEPHSLYLKLKSNKLPKQEFLNNLYDLYNLIYLHFDILDGS